VWVGRVEKVPKPLKLTLLLARSEDFMVERRVSMVRVASDQERPNSRLKARLRSCLVICFWIL